MKMPQKEALTDIIKAMQSMQLKKVKGYKKVDDEMPTIEIEEEEEKDKEEKED